MFKLPWRMAGVALGVVVISATVTLSGQEKKNPPASFSGRLMKYTAKKGSITQILVLQPTPQGKTLQEIYDLAVSKSTKFIITAGDTKVELDSRSVLTDDRTKDMLVQKAGSTLGDNSGLAVAVETKGKAATKVSFKKKF